jgi:HPt (histidine-containing phosphotransfer) domain-containing protein
MDGYVSKPIQPHELFEAIDSLLAPAAAAAGPSPPAPAEGPDCAQALARVGGDRALLRELAGMFLESLPQQLEELHTALGRGDGPAVQRLAHTIKGAVGTFGARRAFDEALRLETMARKGDLSDADRAWTALEEALAGLRPALTAWAAEGQGE